MPKPISIKDLEKIIDPSSKASEANESVRFSDSGPGELDKWSSVLEEKKNPWIERTNQKQVAKKKRLIFSNPHLGARPLTPLEIELFDVLFANYEVLFWNGENTNLSNDTPVLNTHAFWEMRSKAQAATQKEIDDILTSQGKSANDYFVLDHHNCMRLLQAADQIKDDDTIDLHYPIGFRKESRSRYSEQSSDFLDLSQAVFNMKEIKRLAPLANIKELKVRACDIASIDFNDFPQLEKIIIADLYGTMLLSLIDNDIIPKHLTVEVLSGKNFRPDGDMILIHSCLPRCFILHELENVTRVRLTNSDFNEEIIIPTQISDHVERFTINNIPRLKKFIHGNFDDSQPKINLSLFITATEELQELCWLNGFDLAIEDLKFNNLKKITVNSNAFMSIKDRLDANKLEELYIKCVAGEIPLKIENFPNLKILHIKNVNIALIPMKDLPQLEELHFDFFPNGFVLSNYKKLKKLSIKNLQQDLDLTGLDDLEELEIEIQHDDVKKITFSPEALSKLKRIKIINQNGNIIQLVNLEKVANPSLESIELRKAQCATPIDFSVSRNLNKVTMNCCAINVKSQNKISEVKLIDPQSSCHLQSQKLVVEEVTPENQSYITETLKNSEHVVVDKSNFQDFPILSNARILETNYLFLNDISKITELQDLKELKLLASYNVKLNIHHMQSLKVLDIGLGVDPNLIHIDSLPELEVCKISISPSTSFDFSISNCPSIRILELKGIDNLNKFKFENLQNVEELTLENCDLSEFDFSKFPNLKRLKIINCSNIPSKFKLCPSLESFELVQDKRNERTDLEIRQNKLYLLSLEGGENLKYISIDAPKTLVTNFQNAKKVENLHLDIANNSCDISPLKQLKKADLYVRRAKTVNASNLPQLAHIKVYSEALESINLNNTTNCKLQLDARPDKEYIFPSHILMSTDDVRAAAKFGNQVSTMDTMRQRIRENMADQSPVSCFSDVDYDDDLSVKANISRDKVHKATGKIKSTVLSQKNIPRNYLRNKIINRIESKNGNPDFKSRYSDKATIEERVWPTFNQTFAENYTKIFTNKPDYTVGLLSGEFQVNRRYTLATFLPQEKLNIEIYCKDSQGRKVPGVELIYDPDLRTHFVNFKKKIQGEVEILYIARHASLDYTSLPKDRTIAQIPEKAAHLLDDDLRREIEKFASTNPEISNILTKVTLEEKMAALIEFCNAIQDADLSNLPNNSMEILKLTMQEKKGVCEQKSQVFMLLAHYLDVPVNINLSERHAFAEIPYVCEGSTYEYYSCDLGGGVEYDASPPGMRTSILSGVMPAKPSFVPPQIILTTTSSSAHSSLFSTPISQEVSEYLAVFNKAVQQEPLKSIATLFDTEMLLPPLIKLSENQSPFSVHAAILDKLSIDEKKKTIYIDKASDFKLYLDPYCLENGERIKVRGPLYDVLEKGGNIIVNWTNFSDTEIASYKSILDAKPTLLGHDLKDVKVIGLQKNTIAACSSFNSRCKPFVIADSFLKSEKAQQVGDSQEIDLFELPNWRRLLLGDIEFKGNEIILKPGPLKEAFDKGKNLHIINPPLKDKEFDSLVHRLNVEKKVLYNGKVIEFPENFQVTLGTRENKISLAKVKVLSEDKISEDGKIDNREHIFLSLNNLHECFLQTRYESGKATDVDGLLHTFDNKKHVFYLTENISKNDWQYVLSQIEKDPKLKDKDIEFKLAPNVSIDGVAVGNPDNIMRFGLVYISNDPDYRALELKQAEERTAKKVTIIDVTPQTTFQDLFVKIENRKDDANPGKVNFIYEEKELLHKLINGETFILNGELSPLLYQQLLPLFSTQKMTLNGERIEVSGKLISVQPKVASHLKNTETKNYVLAEYLKMFPEEDDTNIQKINQFFELVKRLPHRGLGRPTEPNMTHQIIKNMLHKLKSKNEMHLNNPIKGLILYDYPKESEDYAYLNVVAKVIFSKEFKENDRAKVKKLRDLLDKYKIKNVNDCRQFGFRLLNCLSKKDIIELVGNDKTLVSSLSEKSENPELTPEILDKLWRKVNVYCDPKFTVDNQTKPLHIKKRQFQFETLFNDPTKPLIMFKGEAGSGKTNASEALKENKNCNFHDVKEGGILSWLNDNGKTEDGEQKNVILYWDEFNMSKPGEGDFIKGLFREPRVVYYQGQKYELTEHHKIIVNGNPESYAERFHHEIIRQYAETIHFMLPDEAYIAKEILPNILKGANVDERLTNEIISLSLKVFALIQECHPGYRYSLRDMINATEHFIVLLKATNNTNLAPEEIFWFTCMNEYAGTIKHNEKLQKFQEGMYRLFSFNSVTAQRIDGHLANHFKLPAKNSHDLIELSEECTVPIEVRPLLNGMCQALAVREKAIKIKEQEHNEKTDSETQEKISYYKNAFAICGEPGIGKSTMIEELVKLHGLSKNNATAPTKSYTVISAGEEEKLYAEILKAAREGSVIILDELNLDKNMESFLKDILDNKDKYHPGFMLFCTYNPGSAEGRVSISEALLNRMQVKNLPLYSEKSLDDLASFWKVKNPQAFRSAYQIASKKNIDVNTRTFLTVMKNEGLRGKELQARRQY